MFACAVPAAWDVWKNEVPSLAEGAPADQKDHMLDRESTGTDTTDKSPDEDPRESKRDADQAAGARGTEPQHALPPLDETERQQCMNRMETHRKRVLELGTDFAEGDKAPRPLRWKRIKHTNRVTVERLVQSGVPLLRSVFVVEG